MALPLHAIDVDGRRLEYAELPAGPGGPDGPDGRGKPVVVLVHGGNCTADDWEPIAPRLTERYRLILPDGLVHPLDPWRIWLLLDHLGVADATLVGHSAGGPVVVAMYRLRPQRVRSLVTIDSNAVGPACCPTTASRPRRRRSTRSGATTWRGSSPSTKATTPPRSTSATASWPTSGRA